MADFKDVADQELRLQELHNRMDGDKGLYYLSPYVLRDSEGKDISGVISVTLNIPATFAAHVHASLMGATQQVRVSGKKIDHDAARKIERFLEAAFESADMRLRRRGDPALRPFVTEQMDIRGRGATRCTVRREDGKVIIDIIPIDTRYFTYEMGVNGMLWGAYKTWRSPAMVHSEYPEYQIDQSDIISQGGGQGTLNLVEVTDFWDEASNKIYVHGKLIRTTPNRYGEPPFAVEIVPMGSMLQDGDRISHRGESIFYLIRDLIPELNRLASILQTLNLGTVKGPMTWHSQEGTQAEPPDHLQDVGSVTAADIEGGAKMVPLGDVNNAGQLLQNLLSRVIQQGSLSSTDFGSLQFPLSAVALVKLGESSGQVFLPRLGAKGMLFEQLARKVIKQILALGVTTVELGEPGHEETFSVGDLKGSYSIEYLYTVKSPETDVARYSIAQIASLYLDQETILEDVLKVENPAEIQRRKRIDEAELISPNIKRYRTAKALLEEGDEVEAELLVDEMGTSIEALASGEPFPEPLTQAPIQPTTSSLLPLTQPDTKSASNKRASQLQGQPGGLEGRSA